MNIIEEKFLDRNAADAIPVTYAHFFVRRLFLVFILWYFLKKLPVSQ